MNRYPIRRRRRARENPLSSGEKIAFAVGGAALLGAILYAVSSKSSSPTPAAHITLVQGHRYSLTGPLSAGMSTDKTTLQAALDSVAPGVYSIVTVSSTASSVTIVMDVIGTPPPGAGAVYSGLQVQDLGPTPAGPSPTGP